MCWIEKGFIYSSFLGFHIQNFYFDIKNKSKLQKQFWIVILQILNQKKCSTFKSCFQIFLRLRRGYAVEPVPAAGRAHAGHGHAVRLGRAHGVPHAAGQLSAAPRQPRAPPAPTIFIDFASCIHLSRCLPLSRHRLDEMI